MPQALIAENTPFAAGAALLLLSLLAWRVTPAAFRSLSWKSVGAASALFWGALAAVLLTYAWEFYYSQFAPSWYRFAAPLGAIALYALLGVGIRWAALRLPGHPVVWFCLLGGLESIPEHAIGIYRFDILQIPALQGSTAEAVFLFAFFEYVLYWSLALLLALGVDRLRQALVSARHRPDEGFSGRTTGSAG